jgi:hypothetical protein
LLEAKGWPQELPPPEDGAPKYPPPQPFFLFLKRGALEPDEPAADLLVPPALELPGPPEPLDPPAEPPAAEVPVGAPPWRAV